MKLSFNGEQKRSILDIVKTWKPDQMNQDVFRDIQRDSGIPARLVETVFWEVDTVEILSSLEWLVFKGGTCVQSYLPVEVQRASVDIDVNSSIQHPKAILARIDDLNVRLVDEKRAADIEGIDFGQLEFIGDDKHSGTLNFKRRMPSRFGEIEKNDEISFQAKSLRVQINYKHAWLPAINPTPRYFQPFILEYQQPRKRSMFPHSSPQDLLVDKILTITNVGPFGRERYKDVYDLFRLTGLEMDMELAKKKLLMVSQRASLDPISIINGARDTLSRFAELSLEARGFSSMVCKGGRRDLKDWEGICLTTMEWLNRIEIE